MRLVEFLLGLTLIVALLELPICAQTRTEPGAKQNRQPAGEGVGQKARPVYSIFEGTIVEMPWPEIKKAAERNALVLLPIGVIEEHGPHMGAGIDTYVAWQFSKLLKEKLQSQNIEAVVLPPMYWGVMDPNGSGAYPGSLRVRPETMKAVLMDELAAVKSWGFKNVFILNPHGDPVHQKTVTDLIPEAEKELGIDIYNPNDGEGTGKPHPAVRLYTVDKPFQPDVHAGATETAVALKYFPGEVNTEVARMLKPQATWHPQGYVGDPANFDKVDLKNWVDAHFEFLKDNVVAWLAAKNGKQETGGERK